MTYVSSTIITTYQLIGIINDESAPGLESIWNYMNENYSKDEPAINEHLYHITKKQCNEETHNIYNIDKTKTHNISIIDIQMNIITIENKMEIQILEVIYVKKHYRIMNMY